MSRRLLKKIHGSIFLQLLGVILVTGLVVIFVVSLFFRFVVHHGKENPYRSNLKAYAHYIINDLGQPPNLSRARQLANQLYIEMRYQGAQSAWSTSQDLISFERADQLSTRHRRNHRSHFLVVNHQLGRFLFQPNFKTALTINPWAIIGLILGIILIFTLAWFWIRWILKPLTLINNAVLQVGQGKLDHQIPLTRQDELGQLAHAFNRMTKQLQEMIKSKDLLLLDISHELRSPLTRLKVALAMHPGGKTTQSLEADVQEMEHLINQLLDAGKLDNKHWQPNKLKSDVRQVFDLKLLKSFCQPIALRLTIPDECNQLMIDPDQFKLVLKNILENAGKHTPPNGQAIKLTLTQDETSSIISIQDHGLGIPKEDLGFVFEPFYRVDPSRSRATGGFGLGLSICKRIIEAHEGSISIKSTEKVGTTVKITLPRA